VSEKDAGCIHIDMSTSLGIDVRVIVEFELSGIPMEAVYINTSTVRVQFTPVQGVSARVLFLGNLYVYTFSVADFYLYGT